MDAPIHCSIRAGFYRSMVFCHNNGADIHRIDGYKKIFVT